MSSDTAATMAALRGLTIDRTSPVPLYFQVSQHLERAIASGDIPNGALFGSEVQLAEQLGLSRPTMRRAMQHLVDKGIIVRRRGIGTRLVQPKLRRPLLLTSLYDDLAASDQKPTTEVLDFGTVEADDELAERLGVSSGDPLIKVIRLRSARGEPIAKMTNYLPSRIGDLTPSDLESTGLYELFRQRTIQLHSATQTVGARTATAAEARMLREPRGAAVLTMQRVTYDDHGTAVEYGTHIYAANRYSFEIHLLTA